MAGLTLSFGSDLMPDSLVAALRQRAAVWFPDCGPVVHVRPGCSRRLAYSAIHRAEISFADGTRRAVVVKIFADAEQQFLALRSVWPAFASHPMWRIPQPLAVLDGGTALVMTAVEGRALHDRLPFWGLSARLASALADCRAAGGWLRFYHELTKTGQTRLDVGLRVADAESAVAELTALGVNGDWADRVRRVLGTLARALDGRFLDAALVHGEYTVDNVFVNGRQLAALDLWGRHRHAVHHDLASFLNSLWLVRLTRPAFGAAAIARLGRSFLAGYSTALTELDHQAIAFLQVAGLVDAAVEIAGRSPSRLGRVWLARVIRGALARLSAKVEDQE